jgi:hypothetical protein
MATNYIQWRVIAEAYKEIFDNEPEARRAYGKQRNLIKEEEEGRCELQGRTSHSTNWVMLQEFELGDNDTDADDE